MTNNGIVQIHGKDYMTVARRVELAHQDKALESIETQVLNHTPVVVKALVKIKGQIYTGISSVNPESNRIIERDNPYEVAETSAGGRALGFAGYGVVESIASADEMARVTSPRISTQESGVDNVACEVCGQPAVDRRGMTKGGKSYHGIFCTTQDKSHTRWMWN